jgi:prevent-host-death family protein
MSEPSRTIPLRELRNNVSEVLRQVDEEGVTIRVTVRGRPVADLAPVRRPRRWVSRADLERIIREAPLDPDFKRDVREWTGQTTDELRDPWQD